MHFDKVCSHFDEKNRSLLSVFDGCWGVRAVSFPVNSAQRPSCRCVAVVTQPALQDSEAGHMAAPDELAREEADLRAQREEGAKKAFRVRPTALIAETHILVHRHRGMRMGCRRAHPEWETCLQDALVPQEQAALDSSRYDQLDKLLDQTGMYTTFLSEQLQAMDDQMFADTEAAVGQKRKVGRQGGRARKKGAAAQTTAGSKKVAPIGLDSSLVTDIVRHHTLAVAILTGGQSAKQWKAAATSVCCKCASTCSGHLTQQPGRLRMSHCVQSLGAAGACATHQGGPSSIPAEGDQVDGVALEQRAQRDPG